MNALHYEHTDVVVDVRSMLLLVLESWPILEAGLRVHNINDKGAEGADVKIVKRGP